ncbi:MAG: Spy/CpxP family protein refolding chaperone [Syntrophomonadaceae bacterium]
MKKGLVLLTLTLALVLAASQMAAAAGPGNVVPPRGPVEDQNWVPLAEQLNLSDRQVQQLKEINLSTHQTTKALKVKLIDARFELRQLMITGSDKAAINAKTKEINDLKTQLHQVKQQKWQQVQSILTAEQQTQLKNLKGFGHHGDRNREMR